MSVLSERLKELRGSQSQTEMATALGIKYQQWAKYERGEVSPGAEILKQICLAHACSADWLLGLPERGKSAAPPKSAAKPPDCASCKFKRFAEAFKAIQAPI